MDVLEVEAWRLAEVFDITEGFVMTLHGIAIATLAGHKTHLEFGRVARRFPMVRLPYRECPGQLGLFEVNNN
jgi:hypothetical protein